MQAFCVQSLSRKWPITALILIHVDTFLLHFIRSSFAQNFNNEMFTISSILRWTEALDSLVKCSILHRVLCLLLHDVYAQLLVPHATGTLQTHSGRTTCESHDYHMTITTTIHTKLIIVSMLLIFPFLQNFLSGLMILTELLPLPLPVQTLQVSLHGLSCVLCRDWLFSCLDRR